jgi:hypothetical protein
MSPLQPYAGDGMPGGIARYSIHSTCVHLSRAPSIDSQMTITGFSDAESLAGSPILPQIHMNLQSHRSRLFALGWEIL